MNLLMQEARQEGVEVVLGEYIPAARNALVADLYGRLEFVRIEGDAGGVAWYSADPGRYAAGKCFVEIRRGAS